MIDDRTHCEWRGWWWRSKLDIETGCVTITGSSGARLRPHHHPMLVEGQILGGTAHGIGNALFEWMG